MASPAQAAALVFASNPLFSSITPTGSSIIGQSTSYTATQAGDGFDVTITMGSGNCPSSCVNQHTWNYSVSGSGDVALVSELGNAVEVPIPTPSDAPATVTIRLVAGPVCPVERDPPDPACAPRPVPSAQVAIHDPSGSEVARQTTDANGQVTFTLPAGAYYVEPSAVSGLMRQPEPTTFSVVGGSSVDFALEYDTGIR